MPKFHFWHNNKDFLVDKPALAQPMSSREARQRARRAVPRAMVSDIGQ
jgi:hypothetical protein